MAKSTDTSVREIFDEKTVPKYKTGEKGCWEYTDNTVVPHNRVICRGYLLSLESIAIQLKSKKSGTKAGNTNSVIKGYLYNICSRDGDVIAERVPESDLKRAPRYKQGDKGWWKCTVANQNPGWWKSTVSKRDGGLKVIEVFGAVKKVTQLEVMESSGRERNRYHYDIVDEEGDVVAKGVGEEWLKRLRKPSVPTASSTTRHLPAKSSVKTNTVEKKKKSLGNILLRHVNLSTEAVEEGSDEEGRHRKK